MTVLKLALVNCYGPCERDLKPAFLVELSTLMHWWPLPLCVAGDFNVVRSRDDVQGDWAESNIVSLKNPSILQPSHSPDGKSNLQIMARSNEEIPHGSQPVEYGIVLDSSSNQNPNSQSPTLETAIGNGTEPQHATVNDDQIDADVAGSGPALPFGAKRPLKSNVWPHFTSFPYVPTPHTSAKLATVLREYLMAWNVDSKLSTITLDDYSTNDALIEKIKRKLGLSDLIMHGSLVHMRCSAHVRSLIVKDGLDIIKEGIDKIRDSVVYWTATPKKVAFFEEAAKQKNLTFSKILVLDCPTSRDIEFDILGWWRANAAKYPTVHEIARDILAVPITYVASESTFSSAGRIELLLDLQSWELLPGSSIMEIGFRAVAGLLFS
ncbi:Putative AC transposase [Linum grandiflorum]